MNLDEWRMPTETVAQWLVGLNQQPVIDVQPTFVVVQQSGNTGQSVEPGGCFKVLGC